MCMAELLGRAAKMLMALSLRKSAQVTGLLNTQKQIAQNHYDYVGKILVWLNQNGAFLYSSPSFIAGDWKRKDTFQETVDKKNKKEI